MRKAHTTVERNPKRPAVRTAKAEKPAATSNLAMGHVRLEVERITVGVARRNMTALMCDSARTGRAFLVCNAMDCQGPTALLIDIGVLKEQIAQAYPTRTLAQVIDKLPFRHRGGNPRLEIDTQKDDDGVAMTIPGVDATETKARPRRARRAAR